MSRAQIHDTPPRTMTSCQPVAAPSAQRPGLIEADLQSAMHDRRRRWCKGQARGPGKSRLGRDQSDAPAGEPLAQGLAQGGMEIAERFHVADAIAIGRVDDDKPEGPSGLVSSLTDCLRNVVKPATPARAALSRLMRMAPASRSLPWKWTAGVSGVDAV